MSSFFLVTVEAKGERAHKGNKLLWAEVALSQALDDQAASCSLSCVLDGITLSGDVRPAHVEDHGGTAAVLNGSVATELDEVGVAHHRGDVVSFSLDLFDLLDTEAKLGALRNSELVL